jgi:hypothetical protein
MNMRAYLILAGWAVCGCSSTGAIDPCTDKSGVCVGVRVVGNATSLDQLVFTVDKPSATMQATPGTPAGFTLPAKVALLFPAGTSGTINIALDGMSAGQLVAHDDEAVTLPSSGRTQVTMTLNQGTALNDLAMPVDGAIDAAAPDMRGMPIVIQVTGQTTVAEQDTLHVDIVATDPLNKPLTLEMNGKPLTATFNPTAGVNTATLDWTPAYNDSGDFPVGFTAKSSDGVRMTTRNEILSVINAVDLVPNTTGLTGAPRPWAVGDFDNDNFDDIAYCTVVGTAPATYNIHLVYGAAVSLPATLPDTRKKLYTFTQPAASTDASELPCQGGDFNGDGYSDIVIADPGYSGGNGAIYILYGKPRADSAAAITTLTHSSPAPVANENLGAPSQGLVVADLDGDNFADIAAGARLPKNPFYFWFGRQFDVAAVPASISSGANQIIAEAPCGDRTLQAAGDVAGAGTKRHLLVHDPNLGAAGATCLSTHGGLRLLDVASTGLVTVTDLPKPTGKDVSFGANATLCDIDHDGKSDVVVTYQFTGEPSTAYFYFSPVADLTSAFTLMPPGGDPYTDTRCAPGFLGQQTLVLAKTGGVNSGKAGVLDLVVGGTQTPFVASRPITNPDPTSRGFGVLWSGTRVTLDFTGDNKADLIVGSKYSTDPVKWWLFIGR